MPIPFMRNYIQIQGKVKFENVQGRRTECDIIQNQDCLAYFETVLRKIVE